MHVGFRRRIERWAAVLMQISIQPVLISRIESQFVYGQVVFLELLNADDKQGQGLQETIVQLSVLLQQNLILSRQIRQLALQHIRSVSTNGWTRSC